MSQADPHFEALLTYLKEDRGFDFTGYKRSSLIRRVNRRMGQCGITDYSDYLDYLQVHPEEFVDLFNTILINVTGFFRDPEAWDSLRTKVVEPLLRAKPVGEPIRIWSAGCASGEEAYSFAIMLAELLGVEQFRRRVKIYATDVDEEALTLARQAVYSEQDLRLVPAELRERYFTAEGQRHIFHRDLRRSVIFGRNDLVQDAPISHLDLLACRNTLMYFNAETQARILNHFHFALAETGVLFLGKAEMLLTHGDLFAPIDLKRRIFGKVTRGMLSPAPAVTEPATPVTRSQPSPLEHLRSEAFLSSPLAQIVLTSDDLVAMTNREAEKLFGVSSRDIGRPFRDLELSYRPVELRRHIEQVQVDRRGGRINEVQLRNPSGETVHLEIHLSPVVDSDSRLLGVALAFHDVSTARRLQQELEHTNAQLENAYEELQSTNEELETTNEELHSTVEELETTNEELQSTNEELETMNEELHSTNDELQYINEQLHDRTGELDEANAFLETILASLRAGVIVLDRDMLVLTWNRRAEDLWGLRADEAVGRHFLNLDFGLRSEQLRPVIRQAIDEEGAATEVLCQAVDRRGRDITVRVICVPLRWANGKDGGAVLLMEFDEPVSGG